MHPVDGSCMELSEIYILDMYVLTIHEPLLTCMTGLDGDELTLLKLGKGRVVMMVISKMGRYLYGTN
jgi:hypothetical protein